MVRVFASLCIPIAKAFEDKKLNKGICLTKKRGREVEREREREREIKIKN